MTGNEREALGYFKEVDKANAVTMSGKIAISVDYAQDICNRLAAKGFLMKLSRGQYPLYCLPEKIEKNKKGGKK